SGRCFRGPILSSNRAILWRDQRELVKSGLSRNSRPAYLTRYEKDRRARFSHRPWRTWIRRANLSRHRRRGFQTSKGTAWRRSKKYRKGYLCFYSCADAFHGQSSHLEVTYLALEFGTQPSWEVLTALRADHWLHAVPNRVTGLRDGVKRQIRDAFYIDAPWW